MIRCDGMMVVRTTEGSGEGEVGGGGGGKEEETILVMSPVSCLFSARFQFVCDNCFNLL